MPNISTNPATQKQYPIPQHIDDRRNIDAFLAKFPGRKVVVVQGLGFVGAVMSIVCANADGVDYAVIGIDLPTPASWWKICEINAGHFPIKSSDPDVDAYFRKARRQGNFYATADPYAYTHADVVVVDVNLDVDKANGERNELLDYSLSLDGFTRAIETIGKHCREDVLVIVETTVPPGTCQQVVYPVICENLVRRSLPTNLLQVGHSYERVMPGPDYVNSIKNFYRVYSGVDEVSADATEAFLRTIISTEKYPLTRLGNTNATEMAKVMENSYRAMNIAFVVEWSRFAEEAGVNIYEVVNAIRMRPTHANLMFPGVGVGGYCLTKDALMASWARQHLFHGAGPLKQSETGIAINDMMPWYAFNFIAMHLRMAKQPGQRTHRSNKPQEDNFEPGGNSLQGMRFLMLGVSYRSDVADTRYSPPEYLHRFLSSEGASVTVHDPFVSYWEELGMEVPQDLSALLKHAYDAVIVSTSHSEYKWDEELYAYVGANPGMYVFDLVGIIPEERIRASANKRIRVLGRGDL